MQSVSDIRQYFIDELAAENFVTDKTGVKTIELVGASFHADEPTIFGKLNDDYIKRELAWYKSKSLNVNDIPGKTPEIWKMVADKDGYINSNYGWCIWSDEIDSSDTVMRNKGRHNRGQYWRVYNELFNNRDSRRAVMIYTRPTMHEDYNRNGMSDFMCTNAVQYLIRDDVLNVIVQMRSNDVVFGYRNDFAWQDYVASLLENALRCDGRKIIWNVGSLHVYERHFSLVE
jgi:thymidylate synthase